jgi:DNA-directed RNA polymerase subunit F
VDGGKFLSAQRVLEEFLQKYEKSSRAKAATEEIKNIERKAWKRFRKLDDEAVAAFEGFDPAEAGQRITVLRTFEMDPKNASRAKERLVSLDEEWEALRGLKRRIDAFPDLVGAAPGRIEEARDYLVEKGRGSLDRVRREARNGLELLEKISDLNGALAGAALAMREKAYDRAITLLKPFAGVTPRFVGA